MELSVDIIFVFTLSDIDGIVFLYKEDTHLTMGSITCPIFIVMVVSVLSTILGTGGSFKSTDNNRFVYPRV